LAVLLEASEDDEAAIKQILMVRGQVNASDDFPHVHKIIDVASELLIDRLGDRGRQPHCNRLLDATQQQRGYPRGAGDCCAKIVAIDEPRRLTQSDQCATSARNEPFS
jgi:hypothetical protein